MKKEITEVIKSFEDAVKATGRPNTPDFSNVPEDLREHFEAHYQIIVITEALNEGWKPDWDDNNEAKYFPWFWKEEEGVSSGFVFAIRITTAFRMRLRRSGCGFALKRERWQNTPESNLLKSGIKFY